MSRDDPPRTDESARVLRRRTALPGGRAIVGALLVTAAAVGVFAAATGAGGSPSTSYVAVTGPVAPGQRLTAAHLRTVPLDLPAATAATSFRSIEEAVGAVALAPLEGGELLTRSAVLTADPTTASSEPTAEFSLPIERERAVDGALQPGELVDVLATYGTTDDSYTTVVTRGARVTAITSSGSGSLSSPGTLVLTLSLTSPDEVLQLAHASKVAAVTVVRTTRSDPEHPLPNRFSPKGPDR